MSKQIDKGKIAKAEELRANELTLGVQLHDAQEARREAEKSLTEQVCAGETTGDLALDIALFRSGSIDVKDVARYQRLIDLLRGQSGQLVLTWYVITEDVTPEIMYMHGGAECIAPRMRSFVTTYYYRVGVLDGDSPIPKEQKGGSIAYPWTQHDCLLPTTRHASFYCSDSAFGVYEPKFNLGEDFNLEILVEEGGIPEIPHRFIEWKKEKNIPEKGECYVMVGTDQVETWLKEQGGDELHNRVLESLNLLVLTPTTLFDSQE